MIELFAAAPVALTIMVVTILASLLAFSNDEMYGRWMLHPYSVSRKQNLHTLFTSGIIHADWMHLFFNMFSYYAFAFTLEQYMGHWQFATLYLVSLVLSDLPTVAKHKNNYNYYSLGASGAVSAVIFGFILYSPMSSMYIMPIPIPIKSIIFGALYLVYCHYASKQARDNINHDAHLYGALCGVFITIILNPKILPLFASQITGGFQSMLH